ncbi:hypothetical protein KY285_026058 [Solanum tuberosum]|nr:hypothetical protein KY285_026058 [Solanum tuberosum]
MELGKIIQATEVGNFMTEENKLITVTPETENDKFILPFTAWRRDDSYLMFCFFSKFEFYAAMFSLLDLNMFYSSGGAWI